MANPGQNEAVFSCDGAEATVRYCGGGQWSVGDGGSGWAGANDSVGLAVRSRLGLDGEVPYNTKAIEVLAASSGGTIKNNTFPTNLWFYDLRTNMPSFGKRTPFTLDTLTPFIQAYGKKPDGSSKRKDEGEEGRFRKFTREEIQARGDNLDITWLRDECVERAEDLPEPDEIAAEILTHLQTATEEMEALMELLEPNAPKGSGEVTA